MQFSQLFMQKPWCVPFQFQLECLWHTFVQYTVFFLWWKSWYEADGIYLFIKFGNFATFTIIYAKTVKYTLPIPAGMYLAYVSPIYSIFFMVKIVVRSRRHLFIYKIRSFFNFRNYLCKNCDVYPPNSSCNVFGIRFSNTQYFFYGENRGTKPTASIYL